MRHRPWESRARASRVSCIKARCFSIVSASLSAAAWLSCRTTENLPGVLREGEAALPSVNAGEAGSSVDLGVEPSWLSSTTKAGGGVLVGAGSPGSLRVQQFETRMPVG